ncbi:hypothetical protein DYI95_005900 [Thermaerobacter sp. PB12/4term]|nr:hypothetical protein DYI95_005900 [Thermaerobacter sp. PB12/4term]
MARLRQRVAYLNGLAAGLNLSAQSAEGRVLAGIIEVLDAMAEEMERLDGRLGELAEYLGELDQDLFDLEEAINGKGTGDGDLWDEEDLPEPVDGEAGDQDEEAAPGDFEGALVFDAGIPTRHREDGTGPGRTQQEDGQLVDGLLLECPHCGTQYAVAMDELEFDREPEEDENEFEWVCPHCGEVVHDFLPDADPDDSDDPLEAGARETAAMERPAGDGAAAGVRSGRREPGTNAAPVAPAGAGTAAAPAGGAAPVAPF